MGQPFKTQIKDLVSQLTYAQSTFMQGGLAAGYGQITNSPVASSAQTVKVAVFFTDGLANQIQETANCPPAQTLIFGGGDVGSTYFVMTTNAATICSATGIPSCCSGFTQFNSIAGGILTPSATNFRDEARLRALATAQAMQNSGITVYCIGLGATVDVTFLRQMANDPSSPTYNPALPSGQAVIAPTAQDMQRVFQLIASRIKWL